MNIDLTNMYQKYNIAPTGLIHVGIHEGQELSEYNNIGIKNVYCFDANQDYISTLRSQWPQYKFDGFALSDYDGEIEFNITNNGQSSSILDLKIHSDIYPDIVYIEKRTVPCFKLSTIIQNPFDYNVLNLDVQGAELFVLKGYADNLDKIDMIYTEINMDELYSGCCLKSQLDEFLSIHNFVCTETVLIHPTWGDAIYIKRK